MKIRATSIMDDERQDFRQDEASLGSKKLSVVPTQFFDFVLPGGIHSNATLFVAVEENPNPLAPRYSLTP